MQTSFNGYPGLQGTKAARGAETKSALGSGKEHWEA